MPKFRTQYGYGAYSEGWGLYSEALAKEMGFDVDPYNDFGRLSGEIWRAIRLVVDTGIHAKGWTRGAGREDYFKANSAQPEAAIKSEIERYILNAGPGDLLQDRHDHDPEAARRGEGGAGRQVRLSAPSTTGAGRRRAADAGAGSARSIAGSKPEGRKRRANTTAPDAGMGVS